jgi:hypothetical protein
MMNNYQIQLFSLILKIKFIFFNYSQLNFKYMKKYFYLFIILYSLSSKAQNIQQITESDLPGVSILPGNIISGENLMNYLGNAADLYMEYGLQKLYINEYAADRDSVTLQVFDMINPPSAFGVYALSATECTLRNIFGSFSCVTANSVAAVNGHYFIYARNNYGSREGQDLCKQLVKLVIDKNPQDVWYAPVLTQSAKAAPFTNTLLYFKGPLGLSKALPPWINLFQDVNFHMFTMNISNRENTGMIASIVFTDESNMNSFLMNAGVSAVSGTDNPVRTPNGLYRSWFKINETKILFLESTSATLKVKDFVPADAQYKWLLGE